MEPSVGPGSDDDARGARLGRRALIGRATAAGLVAWTAPVILDSLASPAAAVSLCASASSDQNPTFSAAGTYTFVTAPGVTSVVFEAWGGGGGGSQGLATQGGGGGGGGAYATATITGLTTCTSYTVTVGGGGVFVGGANHPDGQASVVTDAASNVVVAAPGGVTAHSATGAAGGTGSVPGGMDGVAGSTGAVSGAGGGGGAGANGGGAGGPGGPVQTAGSPGTGPGGGGGGGGSANGVLPGAGGHGADGQVKITTA